MKYQTKKAVAFCEYCGAMEPYTVSSYVDVDRHMVLGIEVESHTHHAFCDRCRNEIFVNEILNADLEESKKEYEKKCLYLKKKKGTIK